MTNNTPEPHPNPKPLDILIIGTGFSGVYLTHTLRSLSTTDRGDKQKYSLLTIDSSPHLGGVWVKNTYPGARVDTGLPEYQFGPEVGDGGLFEEVEVEMAIEGDGDGGGKRKEKKKVLKGFEWTQRFPDAAELQRYFKYVDEKLEISESCLFNTHVTSATYNPSTNLWTITAVTTHPIPHHVFPQSDPHTRTQTQTQTRIFKARYFIPCIGYAAKPLIPNIKGLESFRGRVIHTANWGMEGGKEVEEMMRGRGKRVGVLGVGASGVGVVETIAKEVDDLTIFQRAPATAIPAQPHPLSPSDSTYLDKQALSTFFTSRLSSWDGAYPAPIPRPGKVDPPSIRQNEFERLWARGGLTYWSSNYMDEFHDKETNDLIYAFWRDKVRERVKDGKVGRVLAPDEPVYPFGTKRVPIENGYYEAFNLPHVKLVDLLADPITQVTPTGITLASGTSHPLDILILATGFDLSTGPFTSINIRGTDPNISLSDKWQDGNNTQTFLGMMVNGFPNMIFPYGPQSPAATCNGAVCAEVQGKFIVEAIEAAEERGGKFEATLAAEEAWTKEINSSLTGSLFEQTRSFLWRDNANDRGHLPVDMGLGSGSASSSVDGGKGGKRAEKPVLFFGGVPAYREKLKERKEKGWEGIRFG